MTSFVSAGDENTPADVFLIGKIDLYIYICFSIALIPQKSERRCFLKTTEVFGNV